MTGRIDPSSDNSPIKRNAGQVLRVHTARCAQYSYGHRQIKGRALFLQICGSEIDSDVLRRQNKSAVAQRRFHPFAAFAHRGIRQTDRHEIQLLPGTEIDFDGYRVRLDAEDRSGLHSKKHSVSFPYIQQSSAHLSENFWLPLLFTASTRKSMATDSTDFTKIDLRNPWNLWPLFSSSL